MLKHLMPMHIGSQKAFFNEFEIQLWLKENIYVNDLANDWDIANTLTMQDVLHQSQLSRLAIGNGMNSHSQAVKKA